MSFFTSLFGQKKTQTAAESHNVEKGSIVEISDIALLSAEGDGVMLGQLKSKIVTRTTCYKFDEIKVYRYYMGDNFVEIAIDGDNNEIHRRLYTMTDSEIADEDLKQFMLIGKPDDPALLGWKDFTINAGTPTEIVYDRSFNAGDDVPVKIPAFEIDEYYGDAKTHHHFMLYQRQLKDTTEYLLADYVEVRHDSENYDMFYTYVGIDLSPTELRLITTSNTTH